MITTVTLNAAIDKTYYLPRFPIGQVSRAARVYSEPGGKGINVARVINQLNVPVMAIGFAGGSNGEFIKRSLSRQAIHHDFVQVEDESRLCLNMIDEVTGISTEVLEPGPVISEEDMGLLKEKVTFWSQKSRIVCFSGSLPKGVPTGVYADLIRIVHAAGALSFLDTSGEALTKGVEAVPYFIKPNEDEIAGLLGQPLKEPSDLQSRLMSLRQSGVPAICISLGAKGSLSLHDGRLYRAVAPFVEAVNTVGCGDAFVAGMAVATARGLPFHECLQYATAVGSANALHEKAGHVSPDDVANLFDQVTIEKSFSLSMTQEGVQDAKPARNEMH